MGYVMLGIMGLVIGAVCGFSLYGAAERDNRRPIVWGVVGFLTNIIGVIVYRLTVGPIVKP